MSENVSEIPEVKVEMAEKDPVDAKRLLTAEEPPVEEPDTSQSTPPPKVTTNTDDAAEGDGESDACAILLKALSIIVIVLFFPFSLVCALKMVQEYERAVIFRLGRIIGGAKGPGLFFVYPCMDTIINVDLRTRKFDINPQEILTKDQLTVTVDAVMYLKVIDPILSVTKIENVDRACKLLGATTLRNVLGTYNMTEILSQRDDINTQIKVLCDAATDPWGVDVERVEIMSSVPQNHEHLSLMLSEVLSDVGVTDEMIMKRREYALFQESILKVVKLVNDCDVDRHPFVFGSQSEGSTTEGINSDIDTVWCIDTFHTIHDLADWKPGVKNVLMVQDETTSPGYCLLQRLKDDVPLAARYVPPRGPFYMDAKGRVLLKNTLCHNTSERFGCEQHGPASTIPLRPGGLEQDLVIAFHCERWPTEGRRWLSRRSRSGWPTAQLKSNSEKSGCFLVPASSKMRNGLDDIEWRISTCLAERYLMFSLNNTHMQCYVLMKMLLKSHRAFKDVISSYMCKTALFHCIENTNLDFWQERNLLLCLNQVLRVLYNFVYYKNCPHFIIPENNLMAERISEVQRHNILDVIQHIISSDGEALFEIQTDNVGERLQMKLNKIRVYSRDTISPVQIRMFISSQLCYQSARALSGGYNVFTCTLKDEYNNNNVQDTLRHLLRYYIRYNQLYAHSGNLEQKAYRSVAPMMCSSIGSLLASYYTALHRPLSDIVWQWLQLGLTSDVSSGLLKLATVCYSVGDINATASILRHIEQQYDRSVVLSACGCHNAKESMDTQRFEVVADQIQITDIRHIVSYCVCFLPYEVNIVPQEMRQEYSRSTQEDYQSRTIYDSWMDCAVVDSLPYLYFLQYKIYGRLRNLIEQQRALHELQVVIVNEPYLGHKETALNLLGQCMEQENLPKDAFHCYGGSLLGRSQNNAANFHISRLFTYMEKNSIYF